MPLFKNNTQLYLQLLFWPFVTTQNERQIAVRELSQPFACVRERSPPFAAVRGGFFEDVLFRSFFLYDPILKFCHHNFFMDDNF